MNKTERKKQINSRFYAYVESNFPQYTLDFGEGYGRVYLIPTKLSPSSNSIMYHQSEHYVLSLTYAEPEVHRDVEVMQKYITHNIIPFVDNVMV